MNKLGFNLRAIAGTIFLDIIGEMYYWDGLVDYLRWQIGEYGDNAPMIIRVDSIGGDPRTGLALYGMIKRHKGSTTGYIEYMCDSSATLPICACDVVIANRVPFEYMIHEPQVDAGWVTADEGQSALDYLANIREDFVRIYVEKTGQAEVDIRKWMKDTKWMNAEEALELGFINEIAEVENTLSAKVDYKLAAKAYDRPKGFELKGREESPAQTPKPETKPIQAMNEWMKKIAAKLGLGDNADETEVVLKSVELKAQADTIPSLEARITALESEKTALLSEVETLKGVQPTEEELALQAAAEVDTAVEEGVKLFKISASASEQWKKQYEGKPAELKAALELIPENQAKPGVGAQAPVKARASAGIHPVVAAKFGDAK